MAVEKIVTLCKEGDSTQEYYPNIKGDNIPSGAVAKAKLTQELQDEIDGKAPQSTTYTKTEIDNKLSGKVNVATYNAKVSELETAIGTKANASDVYTKTATDTLLNAKANASDVYTKTETDTLLSGKVGTYIFEQSINLKADKSTTYTKTEIDTALSGKQATLESGTNIKTINNQSILGSGNISISGGSKLINVVSKQSSGNNLILGLDESIQSNSLYYVYLYESGGEQFAREFHINTITGQGYTTALDFLNDSLESTSYTYNGNTLTIDVSKSSESYSTSDVLVSIVKLL